MLLTTKRREKNKSDQYKSQKVTKNEDELKAIIDRVNREAMLDNLRSDEVKGIRRLLKTYDFMRRLSKGIGAFIVGGGGIIGLMQVFDKLLEWIRK